MRINYHIYHGCSLEGYPLCLSLAREIFARAWLGGPRGSSLCCTASPGSPIARRLREGLAVLRTCS